MDKAEFNTPAAFSKIWLHHVNKRADKWTKIIRMFFVYSIMIRSSMFVKNYFSGKGLDYVLYINIVFKCFKRVILER